MENKTLSDEYLVVNSPRVVQVAGQQVTAQVGEVLHTDANGNLEIISEAEMIRRLTLKDTKDLEKVEAIQAAEQKLAATEPVSIPVSKAEAKRNEAAPEGTSSVPASFAE